MTSETIKALLMIAMFGLFEAVMNLEAIQRLRRKAVQFWRRYVVPSHGLQPVPVAARPKRRKG
ncbi:hypothetical protein C2U70_02340 [Bradyrhizobium guangdongense]|uniref:hypothetical protein n=1 Tax=Bradyrhizobium guangdongense TaxID=1325090 RepID=UPI0011285037|nr:hypothetical protein [Bradyrhizobium guangdongense]TPQ41834.1 hypothetical protein C2U70_02340 [Bradyrhizobium guangdongense]